MIWHLISCNCMLFNILNMYFNGEYKSIRWKQGLFQNINNKEYNSQIESMHLSIRLSLSFLNYNSLSVFSEYFNVQSIKPWFYKYSRLRSDRELFPSFFSLRCKSQFSLIDVTSFYIFVIKNLKFKISKIFFNYGIINRIFSQFIYFWFSLWRWELFREDHPRWNLKNH